MLRLCSPEDSSIRLKEDHWVQQEVGKVMVVTTEEETKVKAKEEGAGEEEEQSEYLEVK